MLMPLDVQDGNYLVKHEPRHPKDAENEGKRSKEEQRRGKKNQGLVEERQNKMCVQVL